MASELAATWVVFASSDTMSFALPARTLAHGLALTCNGASLFGS